MQQAEFQWGPPARAVIARGPRACESLLLRRLDELLERHSDQLLARPIRLVVPSKSLRLHVLERVLAHRGRAVVGLDCRTHHGLARSITERSGIQVAIETDLYPLFARRLARRENALRRTLEHLEDGYGSILSSVADLLDAGLDPAHLEALEEALEADGAQVATPFEVERAKALVRVAVESHVALEEAQLGRGSHLLAAASSLIKQNPNLLPSSAVLVHGYNDATGLVTDFLLALVQTFGGEILLDNPPDPVDRTVTDTGVRFAEIYRERLEAALGMKDAAEAAGETVEAPRIELFRALGGEAEAREVAERVRELLETGAPPERIGVVARRLENYRRAIRTHFDRLGVPYSGVAPSGPKHPSAFRVGALVDLLEQQDQVPVERWLDAIRLEPSLRRDLELGFRTLGIARLFEAAALDVERFVGRSRSKGLRLPVRKGLESGEHGPRAAYRYLGTASVEAAVAAARSVVRHLAAWNGAERFDDHLARLEALVEKHLGWRRDSDLATELRANLSGWSQGVSGAVGIDFREFTSLLAARLDSFGATRLGGLGGGVQVLDVVEARSRTFEHLFLLGLNRGVFPRVVQEDSLLPDRLREVLSRRGFGVLPDLHRKLAGFDEERYLFAQLMASSPRIVASWLEVDDEHVFRTPSPLIERLRWSHPQPPPDWTSPPSAPPLFSEPVPGSGRGPNRARPAVESATIAAIFGNREQFAPLLEAAEREGSERFPDPLTAQNAHSLVPVRLRVLDEFDPVRGSASGERAYARLGPYFGFVGAASEPADPRNRSQLFVTTLESLARCPWRTFLEKILRVEKLPDPLEVLPGVDAQLIGSLVHGVLQAIVDAEIAESGESFRELRKEEGRRVQWPAPAEFERLLQTSARKLAFEEGITLPGFDRVLAGVCRHHLEVARELDWINDQSRFEVLASERHGEVEWADPPATIGFKADRVDRNGDRLILTDYKTGKALGGDSRYRKKDRQLMVDAVLAGERLQAPLYARAGGGDTDVGRYAFLKPSLDADRDREVLVRANDEEIGPLFDRAIGATLRAWQSGTFFPRLVQHHQNVEPVACRFCKVAEACLRGDSGSRGRLRGWTDNRRSKLEQPLEVEDRALLRTWYLPDRTAFPAREPKLSETDGSKGRTR